MTDPILDARKACPPGDWPDVQALARTWDRSMPDRWDWEACATLLKCGVPVGNLWPAMLAVRRVGESIGASPAEVVGMVLAYMGSGDER